MKVCARPGCGNEAKQKVKAKFCSAYCREKNWRDENPDYIKAKAYRDHLSRKYGMTVEEYEELLRDQGGVCGICKRKPEDCTTDGRNLHVDHDHDTGAIRGVLCHNCNIGIGCLQDDPDLLRAALDYLGG